MGIERIERCAQDAVSLPFLAGCAFGENFKGYKTFPSGASGFDISIFDDKDAIKQLWAKIKSNPKLVSAFEYLIGEDADGKAIDKVGGGEKGDQPDDLQDGLIPFFKRNFNEDSPYAGGNKDSNDKNISVDEFNHRFPDATSKEHALILIHAGIMLLTEIKEAPAKDKAVAEAAATAAKAEAGKVTAARNAAAAELAAANAKAKRNKVWAIVLGVVAAVVTLFAIFGRGPKGPKAAGTPVEPAPANGGPGGKGVKKAAAGAAGRARVEIREKALREPVFSGSRADALSFLVEKLKPSKKGQPAVPKAKVTDWARQAGIPMSEVEAAASRGTKTPKPRAKAR